MDVTEPTPTADLAQGDRPLAAPARRRTALAEIGATLAALFAVGVLVILVGSVFVQGASTRSTGTSSPRAPAVFGETGGGIAPAIVGTIMLVAIATAIALPIGTLVAIYVSEFAPPRARPAR